MKNKNLLLLLTSLFILAGCNTTPNSEGGETKPEGDGGSTPVTPSDPVDPSDPPEPTPSQPTKHKVAKHTLKDTSVPYDYIDDPGQQVSQTTWNSFKNGSASKFSNHYNFTYTAFYSASNYTQQFFTKDGYAIKSLMNGVYSSIYYERKSGNTFYQYSSVKDGWLREEVTLDLTAKFTKVYTDEVYVHMSNYSDYTYNEYSEAYHFDNSGASSSTIQFKKGYYAYSLYSISGYNFTINNSFCTEITIPESYYFA